MIFVSLALILALRLLGVRDWRCYCAAFLWSPVLIGVQTANFTLLLAFGIAVAWHYKSRYVICGIAVGVLLALKLFLWPLLLWLLATRRNRATFVAALTAVVLTASTWAVIGFAHIAEYLQMVNRLVSLQERDTYTPFAVLVKLGVPSASAHAIGYAIAVGSCVACVLVVRWNGPDSLGFLLAITASLLVNPLTWLHSFALLLVPLAIVGPRFSWLWVLPVLLIACPARGDSLSLDLELFAVVSIFIGALVIRTIRLQRIDGLVRSALPHAG